MKSILAAMAVLAVLAGCTGTPRTQEYFDAHLDERATELKRCANIAPARQADDQNCWTAGQSQMRSDTEGARVAAAAAQAAYMKRINDLLKPNGPKKQ